MKQITSLFILIFSTLQLHAQDSTVLQKQTAEQTRCAEYKRVASKILKDDELFVMFYMDAALVVDPNADTQIVKQIKTDNPWESLKDYLYDKSDIYFCPSGSQLYVAIEYMPCPLDESTTMSSQFGMYRLSSPEELFKNRGESFRSTKHKAVVYGGLNYDVESKKNGPLLAFNRNRGNDGYGELKNAEAEALYIDSLLRKQNVEVALMSGSNGSEKSFYKIPATKADVLHIASHGEYQPDEDNLESRSLEEWMMSHSALILSGYNTASSYSSDDGRLTAYEISQTDLSNIKLAVLSVCKSAKGDIKENEVYGLLKGFKMAGAGTLLLTLDTVNDDITKMLMIRFYENLFRGNDPRSALESAQRYLTRFLVRYGNGKYKDSEEWKKFILVDDLDRNIGQDVTDVEREYFLDDIVGMRDVYSATQLFPKWDNVKKKLRKNDLAIRFCTYSIAGDKDDRMPYVALIGDAKTGNLKVKRLFTGSRSKVNESFSQYSIDNFEYYDSLIWQQLATEIRNVAKIYFQPAGIINSIPIECLPSVIDKYELYRISSFRILNEKENKNSNARRLASFGGLYYDCSDASDEENTSKIATTRGVDFGVAFLPSTLIEVKTIDSLAVSSGRSTITLTKCSGTEDTFRHLATNESIDAFHLSTHTLIVEESLTTHPFNITDYLLGHNGLALSGANDVLYGILDSDGEGILSGAEIARMNMQGVSFVALCGCETGKEFDKFRSTASDNVWSLASAFKKANVRTILCSLEKVEDESTLWLMVEFYKNWFRKNMTPRQALETARKTIRNNPKWEDPRYWAAFILLDGLD